MGFIDNVCPSANEMQQQIAQNGKSLPCEASGPACIFVFKTISEPHVGEMLVSLKCIRALFKVVWSWKMNQPALLEKINQLFLVEGNKRTNTTELVAGDIGATLKLKNTHVNNTLHVKGKITNCNPLNSPLQYDGGH